MPEAESHLKRYLLLHIVLLLYSLNGIFSKMASRQISLSIEFIIYYCVVLLNLFIYAILWQQVLKKLPLSTAFINKSVTVIWGMVWGTLFFKENITLQMVIGALIIFTGVYFVVTDYE